MFEPEFGENDKGVPYKYQTISKKFVKSRDNGATYTKSVFSIYFVIFAEHVVVAMLVLGLPPTALGHAPPPLLPPPLGSPGT